ncbi:hypothetical protein JXA40_05260 [bacterium]|nr:hypothetical protein [candidate division CSSED10-310 bacterium]
MHNHNRSARQTVASYVQGTGNNNNTYDFVTITLDEANHKFPNNLEIGCMGDASGNTGGVYIDQIKVKAV